MDKSLSLEFLYYDYYLLFITILHYLDTVKVLLRDNPKIRNIH